MQTLIFNFKTKTVGVVGSPQTSRRDLDEVLKAQREAAASSPSTLARPQRSR
jgi:hypothetical protein